jgi:hypothetical protein
MDIITIPSLKGGTFIFKPKKETDYFPEAMVLSPDGKIIAVCIDLIGLYPIGVLIQYPCGTKRFIKDYDWGLQA